MKTLILILHNIRSVYNVGAILRTSDGLGVAKVYFSGYTPYAQKGLAHEREKLTKQLHKTALGAENSLPQAYCSDIHALIQKLKAQDYQILALEQAENSQKFPNISPLAPKKALILGEEVHGISADILSRSDQILEIPMHGTKESFNVSVAAGIALWELSQR